MNIKKCVMVFMMCALITPVFANENIEVNLYTDNAGNIFGKDENVVVKLNVDNTASESKQVNIAWRVVNKANSTVADNGTETINIQGTAKQVFDIEVDCPDYGLYKIEADVSWENGNIVDTLEMSKVLTSASGERNKDFGFASHIWRYGSYLESVELMQKAGAGGWSDGITWVKAEMDKGKLVLNSANKKAFEASASNTENMMVLGFGNPDYVKRYDKNGNEIAVSDVHPPITEDELQAFGKYCAFIAEQTKGTVKRFQIWNEWELDGTNPERLDAKYYVEILKTAYNAIKSVNKKAEVVGMGGAIITSIGDFDKSALEAGVLDYCDALSIHIYDYHRFQYFPNKRVLDDVKERIDLYKSYMKGEEMPIYISETGWSTTSTAETAFASPYSEKEQAENLVKSFVTMKALDLGDKMYWYDFQDDGEDATKREHRFGVVTSRYNEDGALLAKPSYLAAAAMNKIMSGGISRVEDEKFQSYTKTEKMWSIWGDWERIEANVVGIYPFERNDVKSGMGKNLAVLWSTPKKRFQISTGSKSIDCYDMYGNCERLYSDNGIYDIDIEDEIIYLSGDFKFFNIDNQTVTIDDVSYDENKNLMTVRGTSEGMSSFNIELLENGNVVQNEICNVKEDGTFERIISVNKDGLYTITAGKESIEGYGKWNTPVEVKKTEEKIMDSQIGGVVVSGNRSNLTISGQLMNISEGEDVSLIIVPEGKELNPLNILSVNQKKPNADGEFTFEISLQDGIKAVDIYIGANYADKVASQYSYDICRVVSFNLDELDGNIIATAIVENSTAEVENHSIIIAQYDTFGALVGVVTQDYAVVTGERQVLTLRMPKDSQAKRCSAFIWDINNITPLFKNAEINF